MLRNKFFKKGFTLIELLIVIGILAILVVALLVTLNPQEAQRKARDTKRMADLATLNAAILQYYDNNAPPALAIAVTSAGGTIACAANWTGLNLCPYMQTVPIDPSNNTTRGAAGAAGAGVCPATTAAQLMVYRLNVNVTGEYEVNVREESTSNCKNLTNDGGNSNYWAEQGSNLTLVTD